MCAVCGQWFCVFLVPKASPPGSASNCHWDHQGVSLNTLGCLMRTDLHLHRNFAYQLMEHLYDAHFIIFIFNPHPRICLLILKREEGMERERDRQTDRHMKPTAFWCMRWCSNQLGHPTRAWCQFYFFKIIFYAITVVPIFPLWPPPHPPPHFLRRSPHCCPCPWIMCIYIYSIPCAVFYIPMIIL